MGPRQPPRSPRAWDRGGVAAPRAVVTVRRTATARGEISCDGASARSASPRPSTSRSSVRSCTSGPEALPRGSAAIATKKKATVRTPNIGTRGDLGMTRPTSLGTHGPLSVIGRAALEGRMAADLPCVLPCVPFRCYHRSDPVTSPRFFKLSTNFGMASSTLGVVSDKSGCASDQCASRLRAPVRRHRTTHATPRIWCLLLEPASPGAMANYSSSRYVDPAVVGG